MEFGLNDPHGLQHHSSDDGNGDGDKRIGVETGSSVCPELWHACAGPLISLPPKGSPVVYFPQGHLEQIADNELHRGGRGSFLNINHAAAPMAEEASSAAALNVKLNILGFNFVDILSDFFHELSSLQCLCFLRFSSERT